MGVTKNGDSFTLPSSQYGTFLINWVLYLPLGGTLGVDGTQDLTNCVGVNLWDGMSETGWKTPASILNISHISNTFTISKAEGVLATIKPFDGADFTGLYTGDLFITKIDDTVTSFSINYPSSEEDFSNIETDEEFSDDEEKSTEGIILFEKVINTNEGCASTIM